MQNVNWWLMALAFLLGLVLTLFSTIRRVKGEVPEYATGARGARGVDDADEQRTEKIVPAAEDSAKSGAVAGGATGVAAAGFADTSSANEAVVAEEPYGPGSVRVSAGAAAPSGYDIKGNEDSMLYHSPESPSYKRTIAEVWFRDVETAEAAGFNRWDSGKSRRVD